MEKVNCTNYLFIVNVNWGDRWQTYHRLAELEIPCKFSTGKLLEVIVKTPTAALQVWSVGRQQKIQRRQIIDWLEHCFKINYQQVGENIFSE